METEPAQMQHVDPKGNPLKGEGDGFQVNPDDPKAKEFVENLKNPDAKKGEPLLVGAVTPAPGAVGTQPTVQSVTTPAVASPTVAGTPSVTTAPAPVVAPSVAPKAASKGGKK